MTSQASATSQCWSLSDLKETDVSWKLIAGVLGDNNNNPMTGREISRVVLDHFPNLRAKGMEKVIRDRLSYVASANHRSFKNVGTSAKAKYIMTDNVGPLSREDKKEKAMLKRLANEHLRKLGLDAQKTYMAVSTGRPRHPKQKASKTGSKPRKSVRWNTPGSDLPEYAELATLSHQGVGSDMDTGVGDLGTLANDFLASLSPEQDYLVTQAMLEAMQASSDSSSSSAATSSTDDESSFTHEAEETQVSPLAPSYFSPESWSLIQAISRPGEVQPNFEAYKGPLQRYAALLQLPSFVQSPTGLGMIVNPMLRDTLVGHFACHSWWSGDAQTVVDFFPEALPLIEYFDGRPNEPRLFEVYSRVTELAQASLTQMSCVSPEQLSCQPSSAFTPYPLGVDIFTQTLGEAVTAEQLFGTVQDLALGALVV